MNKSTNIPYNMNFTFDEKLHEVPVNMDEMKKGISQLKQQIAKREDSKAAGQIGVYSRIVKDFDTSKRFLEMAYHMEKQANHARGQFINRIRLANTYQWNKEFQKSNEIFDVLLREFQNQADESLQDIEDFLYQHMGKNKFDQGEYEEALAHFYKALEIRLVKNNSELIESTRLAIDVTLKMHNE